MTSAARLPAAEVEAELVVLGVRRRLLDDVPAGRLDQRVEPHRQRLRPDALDADELLLGLRRLDDLVPRHRLRHVQPGRLRRPTSGTRAAGCWPRTGWRRACRSTSSPRSRTDDALGHRLATSSGTGARKPAWANSGMNGGSRLMMSIDESEAARRRTSCSRCAGESRGSTDVSIVYFPAAALVQRLAISAWPPASGLMYQVSVGGPPDSASAGGQRARGDQRHCRPRDPAAQPPRPARVLPAPQCSTAFAGSSRHRHRLRLGVRATTVIAARRVVQVTERCQFQPSRATK